MRSTADSVLFVLPFSAYRMLVVSALQNTAYTENNCLILMNKKEEDKNCKTVLWVLAIIGAVAAVAAIAYAVYCFFTPDYLEDFEEDFEDDFDDDFFNEDDQV